MAVALRGTPTTSGANDGPQSSSRSTAVPTGSAVDDIAVLIFQSWTPSAAPTVTWPTGFAGNEFYAQSVVVGSGGNVYHKMAWKRLTGADSGSYSCSYSATIWNILHCVTVSGAVATGSPIEASNSATATSTTVPSTSVTTVTQPFLLHSVATFNDATQTPPTNFTEDLDSTVLHTNHRIPGSTGTFTVTGGTISVSTEMVVGLVAIAAGGGAPVRPPRLVAVQQAINRASNW